MKKIYLELPIVKVDPSSRWQSKEYAQEHFEKGMFLVDDGIVYHFVHYFEEWPTMILIPKEQIEDAFLEEARQSGIAEVNGDIANDIDKIKDRVEQIARLVNETKDEVRKSENRLTDTIVEQSARQITEFNILRDGLESAKRGNNDGTNVLDVARAFAVISKPELIKELK